MAGLIIGAVAFALWTAFVWTKAGELAVSGYKEKIEAAQQQVDAATKRELQNAANAVTDMTAAYEAGEAQAKTVEKKVYIRVAEQRQKYAAFADPACALPAESIALLTAALKGVRGELALPPAEEAKPAVSPPATPATLAPPKPVPKKKAAP